MSENECRLCDKLCSFRKHPFDRLAVLEARHATLLTRHNALVEAVAAARKQIQMMRRELPKTIGDVNISLLMGDLAEVDRLIANESTADCEEDG